MIPRRVKINLAAFALLFALLSLWAVRNVVHFDAIERPYRIAADFDSAPGLRANVEVTYLGVRVGSIRSLSLTGDVVRVQMAIDRGTRLPEGLTAAISRKSAVGEPYVSLLPPDGYGGGGPFLEPGGGAVVPLDRTSVPLSYGELFSSLDDLVDAVPGPELGSVLDELAVALHGRGPALRELFQSGEDLTTTLAERSDMFDRLATDLTRLTGVVAGERDAIGAGFDNLAGLTDTLVASRDDLNRLLDEAPAFGQQVEDLLRTSLDDIGCAVAGFGGLFEAIGDDEQIAQLLRVLDVARGAADAFNTSVIDEGDHGADGPYLTGSFGIVEAGDVGVYEPRPDLPGAPPLPQCGERAGDLAAGVPASGAAGEGNVGERAGLSPPAVSPRPASPAAELPESSDRAVADQQFPLALAVGAAGIALLLLLALVVRRTRAAGGGDRSEDGN